MLSEAFFALASGIDFDPLSCFFHAQLRAHAQVHGYRGAAGAMFGSNQKRFCAE